MFCAPGLAFGGTVGVGFRFHVWRSRTHFRRYRGRRVKFIFCAPELIFGDTDGVGTRFHVLRSWTRFRRYCGRRLLFSCFALLESFPIFMFCRPELVLEGTEGVGSHFHVLRNRTHFWRYRERRLPFSCFALPDSFSAVSRASGPDFMFCAPGLVFGDIEGVGSYFHVLRSQTRFRRYRGRRLPFSCFALLG
jgi:hypothetical protein